MESTKNEWINVNEKLPPMSERCLTAGFYLGNGETFVDVMNYIGDGEWDDNSEFDVNAFCKIVYWMPLPTEPVEIYNYIKEEMKNG